MPRPKNPNSKLKTVAADWLNLSSYKAAAGIGYGEWFKQLALRHLAFHTKNDKLRQQIWEAVKRYPIADLTKFRPFLMFGEEATFGEQLKNLIFNDKSGIDRVELKEFLDIADALDRKRYLKSKQWREFLGKNKATEIPYPFREWPTKWYVQPVEESLSNRPPFDLLKIDPTLPKSVLMEHFDKFLDSYRSKPRKIGFTHPNIGLWFKYGLLPLLDIMLWEKISVLSHTDAAKCEAIMPGGNEDSEDAAYSAYMKTLKPTAIDLLKSDSKAMHKLYSAAVGIY